MTSPLLVPSFWPDEHWRLAGAHGHRWSPRGQMNLGKFCRAVHWVVVPWLDMLLNQGLWMVGDCCNPFFIFFPCSLWFSEALAGHTCRLPFGKEGSCEDKVIIHSLLVDQWAWFELQSFRYQHVLCRFVSTDTKGYLLTPKTSAGPFSALLSSPVLAQSAKCLAPFSWRLLSFCRTIR